METDELQILINEARAKLSKKSREAIDSVNWRLIILGMDKKYTQEQLENLETETELLLCGILNPEIYPVELETRMHITKEDVVLLIGEMDKLIFKKIQEELEKRISKNEKISTPIVPPLPPFFDPRFVNMPREVQGAIAISNWKENLYKIAQKYKLNVEQMGILEEKTIQVMQDVIHTDKYESELSSKIIIPKEDLSRLVQDINESILIKIRGLMKKEAGIEDKEEIPLPPYIKIEIKKVEAPKIIEVPEIINTPKNIIEEKLESPTVSDHTVSDYSIPKISAITSQPHDPYHEPIE